MSRWVCVLISLGLIYSPVLAAGKAHQQKKEQQRQQAEAQQEQIPPEEDENLKPTVYAFNPLQAQKEVKIGDFYFKKGNYLAAASRFREATKWNSGYAEAWLRLGDAAEKQNDRKTMREAYSKYLKLEPDRKKASDIRKKLAKLK